MITDKDEQVLVVSAIKQSFEMYATNGGSVQANSNPFMVTVHGEFDLMKTATNILERLNAHRDRKERLAVEARVAHLAAAAKELAAASGDPDGKTVE